jgi:multimeric flavodoxin WrbA
MKLAVIIGSPKGMRGNTGRLLDEVTAGLEDGVETELIDLSRVQVRPCIGCDYCHVHGNCPLKDDYDAIKQSLLNCDGFILASPNYIFSVSAQMKALFDRSGNIIHCLMLEGKYGAVVETSGGGDDEMVMSYMTRFINSTGAQSVGSVGSVMAGERQFPQQETLFEYASKLGKELCRCIREKEHFPDQAGYRSAFKTRMKRLVEYCKDFWPAEYKYWQIHHEL